MSNSLYDYGRQGFLEGTIDWDTDTIKIALVATAYSVNLATHEFWSDVNTNVVGTPATLASKTVTAGVANAAGVTFNSVTGTQVSYLVIYKDTGGAANTNRLIAYIDTGTGLPVTPNGGDIIIVFDSGSNKIFKL
jgi:hypothetical protein